MPDRGPTIRGCGLRISRGYREAGSWWTPLPYFEPDGLIGLVRTPVAQKLLKTLNGS